MGWGSNKKGDWAFGSSANGNTNIGDDWGVGGPSGGSDWTPIDPYSASAPTGGSWAFGGPSSNDGSWIFGGGAYDSNNQNNSWSFGGGGNSQSDAFGSSAWGSGGNNGPGSNQGWGSGHQSDFATLDEQSYLGGGFFGGKLKR